MKYVVIPKLGKILKERKMTQIQLAELADITQATVSRFDRNRQYQINHLVSISRVLNLSIEDLFEIIEVEDEKEYKHITYFGIEDMKYSKEDR